MTNEDGAFRFRSPPVSTWVPDYEIGKPCEAIMVAKGLSPILTVKKSDQRNRVITDIYEIGGVEYLRINQNFKEAISLAYTQADFQGKRIVALLTKEGLSDSQKQSVLQICGKNTELSRIGKWTFCCVIKVLFRLGEIDKEEFIALNKLRHARNGLQHQSVSQYTIDFEKTDSLLQSVIQILLRLRELPVGESATITGYEMEQFWVDIGFGGYKSRTNNKKDRLPDVKFTMPNPKKQKERDATGVGKWGIGCPGLCGSFWWFKPTNDLESFEPLDCNIKAAIKWVKNSDNTVQFQCYDCGMRIKLLPFKS